MALVTFLQHEADVPVGQLAADVVSLGGDVRVIEAWKLAPDYLDGARIEGPLVVLGGTMNAYADCRAAWLPATRRLLARRAGTPGPAKTLGICLGHQLLAVATGGSVRVADPTGPERGVIQLEWAGQSELAEALDFPVVAFADHGDGVSTVPPGARVLARSDRYVQAMQVGNAVGVQFHPEVTYSIAQQWLQDYPQSEALLARTERALPALRKLSNRLAAWLLAPTPA